MSVDVLDGEFSPSDVDDVDDCELLLAGPDRTLAAGAVVGRVETRDGEPLDVLAGRARDLLARVGDPARGAGAPIVAGAVRFDEYRGARLVAVRDARRGPRSGLGGAAPGPLRFGVDGVDLVPWPDRYLDSVRSALRLMSGSALRKVVLARAVDITAGGPVRTADLVRSLAAGDPAAHVFAVRLGSREAGDRRVLVGASPELVVRRTGRYVLSNPLAGSAARSADPAEDRAGARALAGSGKDLREHRIVVDAVADALRPHCSSLQVDRRPSVIGTRTMWHLSTRVRGELATPAPNALELAAALHPTPAVCGWPTAQARRVIRCSEGFDRGHYGGLVGWMDAAGDGEWVLALRCAEVDGDRLRLYAGAGVVPGSVAHAELAETSAKFQTFLSALGLDYEAVEARAVDERVARERAGRQRLPRERTVPSAAGGTA